jgi:hypothetical protein
MKIPFIKKLKYKLDFNLKIQYQANRSFITIDEIKN